MKKSAKIGCIPVFLTVLLTCADLERSNPLDPKNPESVGERTVLVEAFVNNSGSEPVINSALNALDRLLREYGSQSFVYLEHHIEKTPGTDPDALESSLARYVSYEPVTNRQGLPDVFFDGSIRRIQGASDADIAYSRYSESLEQRLSVPSDFTVEAMATLREDHIHVAADIARLGRGETDDVMIYVTAVERLSDSQRQIVRLFIPAKMVGNIKSAEIESVEAEIPVHSDWQLDRTHVVLIVQNSRTFEVYKCVQTTVR